MADIRAPKVVLTGGPCAGKTTLTQVIARAFRGQVCVVPEAATLLFSGGFPRWNEPSAARATQRAIYHVQRELESVFSAKFPRRILILDRATVDGAAYWPEGPADFFPALGTSLQAELARYDEVIYLESAGEEDYLDHVRANPSRTESWAEAKRLDALTRSLWAGHPQMRVIKNQRAFDYKVAEVISSIERIIRHHRLDETSVTT